MDEKTEELRDIFVRTTGADTVTEEQEETRGTLDRERDEERAAETVAEMREDDAVEFSTDLSDKSLLHVATGFFDDEADETVAADLDVDEETVFRARTDMHLVDESDREGPFPAEDLQRFASDGADLASVAVAMDADPEAVEPYYRVAHADVEARSATYRDRLRDALDLDANLVGRIADSAREDGLEDATEGAESQSDLSF